MISRNRTWEIGRPPCGITPRPSASFIDFSRRVGHGPCSIGSQRMPGVDKIREVAFRPCDVVAESAERRGGADAESSWSSGVFGGGLAQRNPAAP